jgi:hypothetical protein
VCGVDSWLCILVGSTTFLGVLGVGKSLMCCYVTGQQQRCYDHEFVLLLYIQYLLLCVGHHTNYADWCARATKPFDNVGMIPVMSANCVSPTETRIWSANAPNVRKMHEIIKFLSAIDRMYECLCSVPCTSDLGVEARMGSVVRRVHVSGYGRTTQHLSME